MAHKISEKISHISDRIHKKAEEKFKIPEALSDVMESAKAVVNNRELVINQVQDIKELESSPRLQELSPTSVRKLFRALPSAQAMKEMGTGDVLLFSTGDNMVSRINQLLQGYSWFNHVGMVVKDPPDDLVKLYGCEKSAHGLYIFEANPPGHGNISIKPLETLFEEFAKKEQSFLMWRKFSDPDRPQTSAKDFPELLTVLKEAQQMTYNMEASRFILGWLRVAPDGNTSNTLFCSEAVAVGLQAMGVLDKKLAPTNYMPKHFSYYKTEEELTLLRGELMPERQLLLS